MSALRLGVRGKLFVGSLLIIGVFGSVSGVYLERELRALLEGRIEAELLRHAKSAREFLVATGVESPEAVDALADRLGRTADARITVVAADGRVLGDSDLTLDEVLAVERHAGRPEVRAALATGTGVARRFSTTERIEMLYLAVSFDAGGRRGVVRAARPAAEVDEAFAGLRIALGVAAVLGLALALGVSGFASHFATRSVRELADRAQSIARAGGSLGLAPASDELVGLAGSIDRVARKLADSLAALGGERDRLNAILDSMQEAVLALDAASRVVLLNRAASTLLGLDGAVAGRTLLEVVRSPDLAALVGEAVASGTAARELDLPGPRARRVLANAAALRATGGVVLVLHDVTETRRLEAIRRDFVANVSHELRTPVSVIRAHGETLLHGALDDQARARGFVEGIARNAERLSRLIADLLDLSRVEAGELELEPVLVEIAPIVARSIEAVAESAKAKNLALERDLDGVAQVRADESALEQVLINLLENAVRYTQAGGHVRVAGRRVEGGGVRLEVRDDGPGIEPKHRDRVFERFYRVDPGRSREMGGTGLGLSIVKHLVQGMGGKVGVEPAEPRGAVFWLTLPPESVV